MICSSVNRLLRIVRSSLPPSGSPGPDRTLLENESHGGRRSGETRRAKYRQPFQLEPSEVPPDFLARLDRGPRRPNAAHDEILEQDPETREAPQLLATPLDSMARPTRLERVTFRSATSEDPPRLVRKRMWGPYGAAPSLRRVRKLHPLSTLLPATRRTARSALCSAHPGTSTGGAPGGGADARRRRRAGPEDQRGALPLLLRRRPRPSPRSATGAPRQDLERTYHQPSTLVPQPTPVLAVACPSRSAPRVGDCIMTRAQRPR